MATFDLLPAIDLRGGRVVLDACDQASVVLLEDQAGVVEQGECRLDEATLVRDGQPEAVARHRSTPPVG